MTFRWKAGHLDAAGLQTCIAASSLTLGNLLKHVAFVEDFTFTIKMRGESPGAPWETVDWEAQPGWDFSSAADYTPEELYALWDGAVERSRARLDAADGGLDQLVPRLRARRSPCQPAPARLRPGRGVRPAHRSRRPAPRGRGRPGR